MTCRLPEWNQTQTRVQTEAFIGGTAGTAQGHDGYAMDRILIVDDHREMRELLGLCLRKWSFATVAAGSLEEARNALLSDGPFRMIICDFDLPDGNGLQLFSWLRMEQQNRARFLLMSGSTNFVRYNSEDFMFLAKPFRSEQLRRRVEELIGAKPDT